MRRILRSAPALLAATGLVISTSHATEAQRLATDDPVLQGIWDEAMNNSEFESLAQALLDSIGPRLTASPGIEAAQDWATRMLRSWGVEARTEQYGTGEGWDRGPSHVDLMEPRVRSLEGRILAWSPGTGGRPVEGGVTYPPEIRSPADWRSFLGTVASKWVMLSAPEPTCRADEQWAEFAMRGSAERMADARSTAQQAWNQSLQATDPRTEAVETCTRRSRRPARRESSPHGGRARSGPPGCSTLTTVRRPPSNCRARTTDSCTALPRTARSQCCA